jgi:hypothetical protein
MTERRPAPIGPLALALRHLRGGAGGRRVALLAVVLGLALVLGIALLFLR